MAIPDGFKDEIKARIRPSELIGRTVALKRQGREFVGLSPFKKERTPSFFVNDEKGFYHCFASQEHGDIFTWLQKTQGLSFMEAIEALAQEAGLEVPRMEQRDPQQEEHRKTLLDWIALAQEYFSRALYAPEGEEARMYLERRGLNRSDMERFGLGFAPDNRRGLTRSLIQKGATAQELSDAGLSILPDDGGEPYDRFRGRVMFPIKDARDRLVAFGGRAMSKEVRAKYLNSPETELFHKGSLLYRYPEARAFAHDPKVKAKGLIVAEGYMDVIAFARAGLGQAVAPLGTALTENQLRLLWRAGPEPVVCLDGDTAGTRAAALAAERALELLEPGRTLRFVFLPDGQDPDDLLREQGPQALKDAIADAKPLIDVLWRREVEVEPLDDPDRKAGFRKRIRALVAKIKDPDIKAEYRAEFDVRIEAHFGRVGGAVSSKSIVGWNKNWKSRAKSDSLLMPSRELISRLGRVPSRSLEVRSLLFVAIMRPKLLSNNYDSIDAIIGNMNDPVVEFVLRGDFQRDVSSKEARSILLSIDGSGASMLKQKYEVSDIAKAINSGEPFEVIESMWLSRLEKLQGNILSEHIRADEKVASDKGFEQNDAERIRSVRNLSNWKSRGNIKG